MIQKPRYELLDGLRGVAAALVVWYHFGEGFATSPIDQMLNHGYLAVDFFYVLSGFVLGYAYDARFRSGKLTKGSFALLRLIRLQPMVVLSVILGVVAFLIQGSVQWDGSPVSTGRVVAALILGLFMVPVLPDLGADVRGNGEMFPLNGPAWSLFFEYIGSILYGVWLNRVSRKTLTVVTIISAIGFGGVLLGNLSGFYHAGVGWSAEGLGLLGGFFRLSFSFCMGLLMSRTITPRRLRGTFWICAAILAAVMSCPYISLDGEPSVLNAWYDIFCTMIVFPTVVYLGACGTTTDSFSTSSCEILGKLSYPLYMVHYPVMYLFYAWVWDNALTFREVWPNCIAIFVGLILMAWLAMKYYDTPVRCRLRSLIH